MYLCCLGGKRDWYLLLAGITENTMKLDWKFFLTLLITVAGMAVPVWLWQADLSSKSLSIKLATRIPLQPKEQESISGMEISVDGLRLEKPHLVVFEIRNDGSKPIPTNDFESPVKIHLESETSFVRADVTGRTPKDIDATLISERQSLSLKPTLLNPGDAISITAITSGANPKFEIKARVVGIPNIALEDGTTPTPNKIRQALLFLGAILFFTSAALVLEGVLEPKGILLRRRAAVLVGFVVMFPGVIAFQLFLEGIGIQGVGYLMLFNSALMIPLGFIAKAFNRSQKSAESSTNSEQSQPTGHAQKSKRVDDLGS